MAKRVDITGRKAVSEIVATILIVLFVIVALIIISVFLFQYMKRQSQDITSQCLDTRTSITKAEFNSTLNITTLYLKRTAGDSVIADINFIFDGSEKKPGAGSDNGSLKLLETGRYSFSTEAKPKKIEIAPAVKTKDEKEMDCGVNTIIFEKDIVEKVIVQQTTQACADSTLYGQCSALKPLFCSNGVLVSNCTLCSCLSGQSCQQNGSCQQQIQTCSDNTNFSSCSLTKPLFCSNNGTFVSNCTLCGCDSGYYCGTGGQCMLQRCSDNTLYNSCSATKPLFCSNGNLTNNCTACSCPSGQGCQPDGSCQLLACADGTSYGNCSATKPKLCDNGNLVNNCATCGCDADYECQANGSCQLRICADGTAYGSCSLTKPLFCSNGVLINKCSACSCPSGQQCEADESCQQQTILSGYWKFDEGAGTIAYNSGSLGNNATLINSPAWAQGQSGSAVELYDGNYVNFGAFSVHNSTSTKFFVDVWIYPTQLVRSYSGGNPEGNIAARHVYYGGQSGDWMFRIIETNQLRFEVRNSGNTDMSAINGGSISNINQWYHVRAEWNNGSMSLYQNGVLVANTTGADFGSDTANTNNIYAGYLPSAPTDQKWFRGRIDELQIGNS